MSDERIDPKDLNRSVDAGFAMARLFFSKRGNPSEAHVSEGEMAGMLAIAFQLGTEEARKERTP